jgi:hypothetical protein
MSNYQNINDILVSLLTDCRNRKLNSVRNSFEIFADKVDFYGMWGVLKPIFEKSLEINDENIHPLPHIAAVIAALADDYRLGLGKVVAETFFESTKSATDLVMFRNSYNAISAGSPFRIHYDWIAKKTLYRAAEIDGGLDEYLDLFTRNDNATDKVRYRGVNRVSDMVHAACGYKGWSEVASNETRRSLIRAAFEDPRVSTFENPKFSPFSGTGLAEVIDWGIRARDLGIITDDSLWEFYNRYEADAAACEALQHLGAAREKRLRQWLLDRGACRVTDVLREACVDVALSRKSI